MFPRTLVIGMALSAAVFSQALADNYSGVTTKKVKTSIGTVLADAKGMTLYTFDMDKDGKSNCNDACATNWPPMLASNGSTAKGSFTLIARQDGSSQWAYKGKPVYTWVNDKKKGDVTGDGVHNVWHAIKVKLGYSY